MIITQDTVALVTGANGGIGQSIARALNAHGCKIILSGRRAEALAPIAQELNARVLVADLAVREDILRLGSEAGEVDVLVANAALPASGRLMDFSQSEIGRALDVNLLAPMLLARVLGEGMATRGRGHMVFISSIAGKIAAGGASLYSATKFGLRGFALCLREDLRARGVGVTTVFPGFIRDAGMFADTKIELPRVTGTRSPEEVAAAVLLAVVDNPAEIDVAALDQVLGARLAALSPSFMLDLQRWLGAEKISRAIAEAQKLKR